MSRRLPFSKLHGLENDFLVLEESAVRGLRLGPLARRICNRHAGVGADGICVISPKSSGRLSMRIFNSDGSEAEMSGNGIRCVAEYIWRGGHPRKGELVVHTPAGPKVLRSRGHTIWVDMGPPLDGVHAISLRAEGRRFDGHFTAALGNPQFVLFRFDEKSVERLDIRKWGPLLENHPRFPNRTNVEFAERFSPSRVKVRIWERGAGETRASGTGACAVAFIGHSLGLLAAEVSEALPGGVLRVQIQERRILLGGPATFVCDGHWSPDGR